MCECRRQRMIAMEKQRKPLWGVSFVAAHKRGRIEYNASGETSCQFLKLKADSWIEDSCSQLNCALQYEGPLLIRLKLHVPRLQVGLLILSDVELHELAVFSKIHTCAYRMFFYLSHGLVDKPCFWFFKIFTVLIFFAEKSDKQTRGQSFRGHYRGRGQRNTGRGRGSSQQRGFAHPRSHLVDDDEDIDMDGGRHRSFSRL